MEVTIFIIILSFKSIKKARNMLIILKKLENIFPCIQK